MICSCGKRQVSTWGDLSSLVMVVAEAPLFDDVKNGVAFSGNYGEALKTEMGKVGIQASGCRMLTMYKHVYDEECLFDHENTTLKELMGAKLILMLGSYCLSTYADCTLSEYSGTIVRSKFLRKSIVVAGPSIAAIGKTPLGELRLALELFAEQRRVLK